MDVGLATFLLGLHTRPAVLQGPSLGPLLETAVVVEWVKAFRGSGATETPVPAHAANLAAFAALAGPSTRTALACRISTAVGLRPGVRAVPWHLAW